MNKAAVKHPVAASLVVILIFILASFLGNLLLYLCPKELLNSGEFVQQSIAETVICLVGIGLVSVFGYSKIWGQTANFGKGLLAGGYFIFVSCISALGKMALTLEEFAGESGVITEMPKTQPGWKIAVFLVMGLLIGITEESFFRGVIANLFWDKHAKDPAGVWTATVYTGLIFGLLHSINLLSSEPVGVIVQMIAAAAMGMAFTAIYYRCKNIWVVILIHAFLDICALLPKGIYGGSLSEEISSYAPVMAITSSVPYIILTLFLLRKSKMVEMLARDGSFGAIPSPNGYIQTPDGPMVVRYEMRSGEKSRASLARIAAIAIATAVMLFAGALHLNGDLRRMVSSEPALFYTHSEKWNGERTMGQETVFEVEYSSNYNVEIKSFPSVYNSYVLIQLKKGEEIVFQENYGGRCNTEIPLHLEKGEYSLILVYNCTEITDPDAELFTEVVIK